jgi:hypothetical protein
MGSSKRTPVNLRNSTLDANHRLGNYPEYGVLVKGAKFLVYTSEQIEPVVHYIRLRNDLSELIMCAENAYASFLIITLGSSDFVILIFWFSNEYVSAGDISKLQAIVMGCDSDTFKIHPSKPGRSSLKTFILSICFGFANLVVVLSFNLKELNHLCFSIVFKDKILDLEANTPAEAAEWITALRSLINMICNKNM